MGEQLTHRERKKWATRATITHAAEELFLRKGFDETTVDEIAAAANVSPATVFNYFPTKSEILFADYAALQEDLRESLLSRPAGQTAPEAFHHWVMEARRRLRDVESDLARRRVIDASPSLQAQERLQMGQGERVVAEAVASELGESPDDLRPRLVGAAAMAVLLATLQHGADSPTGDHDPVALFDYALTLLTGGYEALVRAGKPAY